MESGQLVLMDGLGYEEIGPTSTPVSFTTIPNATRRVVVQLAGQPIRWMAVPGQAPTSVRGMLMNDTDILVYDGEPSIIKFVQDAAASGPSVLRIHYFGA